MPSPTKKPHPYELQGLEKAATSNYCAREILKSVLIDSFSGQLNTIDDVPAKILNISFVDQKTRWRFKDGEGVVGAQLDQFLQNSSLCPIYTKKGLKKDGDCYCRVIYLDCTAFKAYNERFGELWGDKLLSFLQHHLNEFTKTPELDGRWVVARKGGDEFHIYLMLWPCKGKPEFPKVDYYDAQWVNFLNALSSERLYFYKDVNDNDKCYIDTLSEPISDDYKLFVELSGFKIHYGIGADPQKAYDNAKKNEKADAEDAAKDETGSKGDSFRGNFNKEVEIIISRERFRLFNNLVLDTPLMTEIQKRTLKAKITAFGKECYCFDVSDKTRLIIPLNVKNADSYKEDIIAIEKHFIQDWLKTVQISQSDVTRLTGRHIALPNQR